MKVKRYVNTREGEEIKRGTLLFLNFKLAHNQAPENYIKLFERFASEDPIVHSMGNKYISINTLFKDEILTKDGYPQLLYGKIATYDILDRDAFYDRKKKETVSVDIGEDIVANFKFIDFYFSPGTHRLAFFDNQPVNSKQVEKYFQQASDRILGEGQVNVTFETDRDIIERILNANYVESFNAVVSYSNRDETSGFEELLEEKTKADNIARLEITAKSPKNEGMSPKQDGLITSVTKLAKSNGYVVATIREGDKKKRTKIDTTNHPMKEAFESKKTDLINGIYLKIISIFNSK